MAKALYIVVVDDVEKRSEEDRESFRYTRTVLQSALQLMGCKPRHAFKIVQRVFELVRNDPAAEALLPEALTVSSGADPQRVKHEKEDGNGLSNTSIDNHLPSDKYDKRKSRPFELYKRKTTIVVKRRTFLDDVCSALAEYKYVGPNQRADLMLACRIRERKESVTVLLCGTSGCGKSTLSSLLGSRLGITTVVSTDSIRHMMRSFVDETQNPLLWASTYHAGEYLDPVAVAEAKAKRKAKKLDGLCDDSSLKVSSTCRELISSKQMAIEGFKAQSEMVIDSLDRLITAWEERKESVVIEGVHLSLNFVMGLTKKHPSIIPFMIYITNEHKHIERFAVRAKYMTLDPTKNKYVKYIRNIRTIQDYLCKRADKHLVPRINNTNVDRSVATIHATVFSCLRRREARELLYDACTNTVRVVDEEYRHHCAANLLRSKVNSVDGKERESGIGNTWNGPLQIGTAEPVNLQFGYLGISACPSDGGTSYAGSVDEPRADGTDTGSRYYSSCCSSPRTSDGPSKELKEDQSVHGSEEEMDDPPEADTDDDLSDDDDQQIHDEVGSVDEEFTQSDEEYCDLVMEDMQSKGYCSDDDFNNDYEEEGKDRNTVVVFPKIMSTDAGVDDKYSQNMSLFLRRIRNNNSEELLAEEPHRQPLCSYNSLVMMERSERRLVSSLLGKNVRKRSLSIPALRMEGSIMSDPILSGGGPPHKS